MTAREKEILDLIRKNPMISQQEIADALKITRSSVGVHITNLMKKGYIAGKGYILSEKSYVTVIGGANIDILGFANNSLKRRDSNPGKVRLSCGGVGRNIAENLSKLGVSTKLICPVGDDVYGNKILNDCTLSGIDMSHSIVFKGDSSSTYLSILDDQGDMEVAISDMEILDKLTVGIIREKSHVIQNSSAVVVDTNLTQEVLYYLISEHKDKDIFIDTVSTTKAMKVFEFIGAFHTIKPNRLEAETLSGIKITDRKSLMNAGDYFIKKGVKNVFISLGEEGVYYTNGDLEGEFKLSDVKVVNATGAGDAFMAGLVYGHMNGYTIKEAAMFASAASTIALSHENTINPMMSTETVKKYWRRESIMYKEYMDIKPEVQKALEEGRPVVALESTIISHGMPYPDNIKMAKTVEQIIRDNGAVPATIGIIKGRLKVGLTDEEIEYMAKGDNIVKASRRDLPFIIAKKLDGATTVASTMIIADLAGIRVFVTGGIGGVHRGAQETFDISADLIELANTNVAVVCAGAKSILDIGLTLEYLETHGVPVIGFGTEEFPSFYTRKSGYKVDYSVESEEELARAIKAKWDLNMNGGLVIGNPIPEQYEMDYETINNAIEEALKEAEEKGIKGKEVTPFLLSKVKALTGGESLQSNIQLVYNNARVGAKLAVELSKLR